MYYFISKDKVTVSSSIAKLNRKLNAKLDEVEFKSIGADKVVIVNNDDLEFIQDKKLMSKIPMKALYKSSSSTVTILLALILMIQLILLVKH